jgi:hypothetical protein
MQRKKGNNPSFRHQCSEPIFAVQLAEEILTSRVEDPLLFEPPGSGSVIISYGSLDLAPDPDTFNIIQAKKIWKELISMFL